MKWTELPKLNKFVTEKMKSEYPYQEKDGDVIFSLPDGLFMRIFSMSGEHFNCLGMEYGETPDLLPDDGDLYYVGDYSTPEKLFDAMLEETKR